MSQFCHSQNRLFLRASRSPFYPWQNEGSDLSPTSSAAGPGSPGLFPAKRGLGWAPSRELGFLEHDPHSQNCSSICLVLPEQESKRCSKRGAIYVHRWMEPAQVSPLWDKSSVHRLLLHGLGRETAALLWVGISDVLYGL